MSEHFSPKVCERLKYYVYLYVDPRTNRPFYVGKGIKNRAFAHLSTVWKSDKSAVIAELHKLGLQPRIEILRYGLTEDEALHVEAAAIDLLGIDQLCNEVLGHGSGECGRGLVEEIAHQLDADPIKIKHKVVLINIARSFRFGMMPIELYDATRAAWVIAPERHHPDYALCVFQGIVREVYEIAGWVPGGRTMRYLDQNVSRPDEPGRREFVGRVAADEVRRRYVGKSVAEHFAPGAQAPIKYVGC